MLFALIQILSTEDDFVLRPQCRITLTKSQIPLRLLVRSQLRIS